MLKNNLLISLLLIISGICSAQNRDFAQKTIDTLSSEYFAGRGYVKKGDLKAANFIAGNFKTIGLKPFRPSGYFYPFSFTVNKFEKKCKVVVDGKTLIPGKDYIVHPGCPSIKKKFSLSRINSLNDYPNSDNKIALWYDTSHKMIKEDYLLGSKFKLKVNLQNKLTWSVAVEQDNSAGIDVMKTAWPENPQKIEISIKSKLVNHTTNNVIGYIEGTEVKDTFIVITAHYDHLGMMGETIFPGANDNASGVAMMLDMAAYFSKNPPKYSIAFMAFAGEEAGLIGSKNYTDNPWSELPLERMKFLINMDLMGSGEKGMAVVNATIFPEYFNKLDSINANKKYLTGFKRRGKAANSDHFWFVERGVKGFFFYLMGDYNHYHDINDNRVNLKLGEYYDKSFLLIRDFIIAI